MGETSQKKRSKEMKVEPKDAIALNRMVRIAKLNAPVKIATFSVRKKDGQIIKTFKIKTVE